MTDPLFTNLGSLAYSIASRSTSLANSQTWYYGSPYLSMTAATLKEIIYYTSRQPELKKSFSSSF